MSTKELIDAAIKAAETEGDKNTQVVLLILRGARTSGHVGELAAFCAEMVKLRFLPQTQDLKAAAKN